MITTILLCTASLTLAFSPGDPPPRADDLAAYRAASDKAGRTADAQLKLAFWCEAHGLDAERLKHLALAVLADPANAATRGLLGLVSFKGHWKTPGAIAAALKEDEARNAAMAEYARRREHMPNTADAHWRLALWCEQNGLGPEARAHLAIVVELDPGRDAAWRRLGFRKQKGRWVTDAQLTAEKAEAEAQRAADRHWKPLLARWRGWLGDKDASKRAQAARDLAALNDPRAVPSLWTTFCVGNAAMQTLAVQVLGQIDSPGATRALAMLAVFSESAEVRGKATETLQRRDPRDFVGFLVGLIRDPVKYQVKPVGGPGSSGALFVNGKQFNVQRLYEPPPMPNIPLFPGEPIGTDAYGLPVVSRFLGITRNQIGARTAVVNGTQYFGGSPAAGIVGQMMREAQANPGSPGSAPAIKTQWWRPNDPLHRTTFQVPVGNMDVTLNQSTTAPFDHTVQIPIGQIALEYQRSALSARQQLADDRKVIDDYNADVRESNGRVEQVLTSVAGVSLGDDQEKWRGWWVQELGYSYTRPPDVPRPTITEEVPLPYYPQPVATPTQTYQAGPSTSTTTASVSVDPSYTQQMNAAGFVTHNCFKAGTPVRVREGTRPIESVKAGDQVLTQDTRTGALSFQPVVAVYHNRPSPTYRIGLGEETIVATGIHRFWKAGEGWVMARDLKPGDRLRTVSGLAMVRSVGPDRVQPVFNLRVAGGDDYFVGERGVLAHDNSLVNPPDKLFDLVPQLIEVTGPRNP
jgi:hypothetical protein